MTDLVCDAAGVDYRTRSGGVDQVVVRAGAGTEHGPRGTGVDVQAKDGRSGPGTIAIGTIGSTSAVTTANDTLRRQLSVTR